MIGIIIAAGRGSRLGPLTENLPKCLLPVRGLPLLDHILTKFRKNDIQDISIVRGYKKEKLAPDGVTFFENNDFKNNNILHSLLYARPALDAAVQNNEEVVISYSDIFFEDEVLEKLLNCKEDIALVVDDWILTEQGIHESRPVNELERVYIQDKTITKIGKHLSTKDLDNQGEFIGLWKFSPKGLKEFLTCFDNIHNILKMNQPFHQATEWQKSYVTDILQEMINNGSKIVPVMIEGNWKEFDTLSDYNSFN